MDCNRPGITFLHAKSADGLTRIAIILGNIIRRIHRTIIVIHLSARLRHDDGIHIRRKRRIIFHSNRRRTLGRERATAENIIRLRVDIAAGGHHLGQINVIHIELAGNFIIFFRCIICGKTGFNQHIHQCRIFGFVPQARRAACRIIIDELCEFRDATLDIADVIVRTDGEIFGGNTGLIRFFSVLIINLHEIAHLPIRRICFFGCRKFFIFRIAQNNDVIRWHIQTLILIIRAHVSVLLFRQYDEPRIRIAADGDFLIIGNTGCDVSHHVDMIIRIVVSTRRISVLIDIEFSVRLRDVIRIALAAVARIETDKPADIFFPDIGVQIHILHRFNITGNIDDIIIREIIYQ